MNEYLKTRKIALVITLVILIVGSIAYFSTNVAERNNKMMYEKIYGENARYKNVDGNNDTDLSNDIKNVKTELV
jgi:hypothetical protein